MRDLPTTRRWDEFAALGRITKELCHSERASREESAFLAVTTKLRTNATISGVTYGGGDIRNTGRSATGFKETPCHADPVFEPL